METRTSILTNLVMFLINMFVFYLNKSQKHQEKTSTGYLRGIFQHVRSFKYKVRGGKIVKNFNNFFLDSTRALKAPKSSSKEQFTTLNYSLFYHLKIFEILTQHYKNSLICINMLQQCQYHSMPSRRKHSCHTHQDQYERI